MPLRTVVLLVVLGLQNMEDAEMEFLFWDGDFPVWLVVVVAAVLGFVIGWFLGRGSGKRRAIERIADA